MSPLLHFFSTLYILLLLNIPPPPWNIRNSEKIYNHGISAENGISNWLPELLNHATNLRVVICQSSSVLTDMLMDIRACIHSKNVFKTRLEVWNICEVQRTWEIWYTLYIYKHLFTYHSSLFTRKKVPFRVGDFTSHLLMHITRTDSTSYLILNKC